MIRKPLAFAERQVLAGLQAFNLTNLAVSSGRVLAQSALSVAAVLRNLPLKFPDGDRLQRVGPGASATG